MEKYIIFEKETTYFCHNMTSNLHSMHHPQKTDCKYKIYFHDSLKWKKWKLERMAKFSGGTLDILSQGGGYQQAKFFRLS